MQVHVQNSHNYLFLAKNTKRPSRKTQEVLSTRKEQKSREFTVAKIVTFLFSHPTVSRKKAEKIKCSITSE